MARFSVQFDIVNVYCEIDADSVDEAEGLIQAQLDREPLVIYIGETDVCYDGGVVVNIYAVEIGE